MTIDKGCVTARSKYSAMSSIKDAKIAFNHEVYGFTSCMVENYNIPLSVTFKQIIELLDLVTKVNKHLG